jgi:hypothetical protein
VSLGAWATCWSDKSGGASFCADGVPPEDPPNLGVTSAPIVVSFPMEGWTFTGTFRHPDDSCRVALAASADEADGHWTLPLTGPAGAYEVDLYGQGPEGDVAVSFAVRSAVDGAIALPRASLDVLADDDGSPRYYGPATLTVGGLGRTPDEGCMPTGSVALVADAGNAVERDVPSEFGPPPYTFETRLELDGTTYIAISRWPADVDETTSSVLPTFEPPLPPATPDDFRELIRS